MELLTLILTLVALGSAILVYYKAGGVSDLKQQADRIASSENFRNSVASLRAAAETVKEKTGEAMAKLATSSKRKINGENRTPGRKVSRGFEDLRKGMVAAKKGSKSAFQNISAWTQKGFQSLVELKSGASKQFVGGHPIPNSRKVESVMTRADKRNERRKHKRVAVDFPVNYSVLGTTVTGRALNACNQGMMVESSLDFEIARQILEVLVRNGGSRLDVEFTHKKTYRTQAEIKHFRIAASNAGPHRYELGLFIPRIR